ncbi:MAG TPA: SGNH/GDSL hydrolase family protein [Nocardioidaceae bacterium]|nr:SGNH/GDSL hydrolase family protein [Nocardioidaceae bacterium]
MSFSRYVALGDSFTEGVGDPDESRPNGLRGWADRVAEVLATHDPDFRYANLAIRGRKMQAILDEQVGAAVALQPDLVTLYAGGNDLMRPSVDIDAMVADYAEGIGKLAATGAQVVLWTGFDTGGSAVFGKIRGRVAIYNELVRRVAEDHGATILDFWRMREFRDWALWDVDRLHMSSAGHERMAIAVLDVLGVKHDLTAEPLPPRAKLTKAQQRQADLDWAKAYAAPWVQRRLTGKSSGDNVNPKRPGLAPM